MFVYCNFYCSPAKKHGLDPPTFGAGEATAAEPGSEHSTSGKA